MLPSIDHFDNATFDEPFSLICAAGFEDRITAVFDKMRNTGIGSSLEYGVGVEYKPKKERNKEDLIKDEMSSLGIQVKNQFWVDFPRFDPDSFEQHFSDVLEELPNENVLLDVSGMSRHLIFLSLHLLAEYDMPVTIFYAEAETYHPTEEEYREKWEKRPDETPAFLTYGVFDIIAARALSSTVKSGQPIITIAFPSFNHKKLLALVSELSPHLFVSILGIPHLPEDRWRKEAIENINSEIEARIRVKRGETSTFHYGETLDFLNDVYDEYGDSHRLVLSPTGSKMQTIASVLFRRVNSDIQIVYPTMEKFSDPYTEGWKDTWVIDIGVIDEAIASSSISPEGKINILRDKINEVNKEYHT